MSAERQAGRELDALVAEKVIVWRRAAAHRGTTLVSFLVPPLGDTAHRTDEYPHYSTDIAAAWAVVEAMQERGWDALLRRVPDGFVAAFDDLSRSCSASVDPREGGMSLAICRAALSAASSDAVAHESRKKVSR